MIDCEDELDDTGDGYDPLSLVSVGLDDEDDEMSLETKNDVHNCSYCTELFTNRKELNSHIKSQHQKACSVACQYCGRVLNDAETYRRHLNNVHQVKIPELSDNFSPKKPSKVKKLKPVFSIPSLVKKCP